MRHKLIAYSLGIACHLTFVLAIGAMAYMLATGLTSGILPIGGPYGRWINILLLIQFPVFHSFFLTSAGTKILLAPFPREIGKDLITTTYAFVSSIQLLIVFLFWTPVQTAWFVPSGTVLLPWMLVYGLSWLILVKALSEAGISMHTGALGWRSVVNGKHATYPGLPTSGLHNQCRHPIYLAFSLIILTAPVWSSDHFLIASGWVFYCLIGPRFKERRIERRSKKEYDVIRDRTPYIIPRSLHFCSNLRRSGKS